MVIVATVLFGVVTIAALCVAPLLGLSRIFADDRRTESYRNSIFFSRRAP